MENYIQKPAFVESDEAGKVYTYTVTAIVHFCKNREESTTSTLINKMMDTRELVPIITSRTEQAAAKQASQADAAEGIIFVCALHFFIAACSLKNYC